MVDCCQNGVMTQKRRSPVLDLNQAFTKEEDEDEEAIGPPWLHAKPHKTWLQLSEHDQSELQQRPVNANLNFFPAEHNHQHQAFTGHTFSHGRDSEDNPNLPLPEQHQLFRESPSSKITATKQKFHVIDIWKSHSENTSTSIQNFSFMEDVNQDQEKSAAMGSLGTLWELEQACTPHVRKSLSPVSPPGERKSLSPVSPEKRLLNYVAEIALPRGRSLEKRPSPHRSPSRRHYSGADALPRRRRDRDDSLSPREISKRRRERSPSVSAAGRSSRGGRSHSRSPPRHRHSPRSRYSPPRGGRYSPRRRSSPISYQPKRRPWSPPPNRNTGLGKPGRNLFIAGFSFGTTEKDLERKFSRYGHVRDVRIVRDRRSGDSRGFGFLSLERDEEADAAIRALDQTEWNGRIVLVEKAKHSN